MLLTSTKTNTGQLSTSRTRKSFRRVRGRVCLATAIVQNSGQSTPSWLLPASPVQVYL